MGALVELHVRDDKVGEIRLDRPPMNAISSEVCRQLQACVAEAIDTDEGTWLSLDVSPDGERLVTTSAGVARVWALDLDDLVEIAEDRVTRSLSDDECQQYLHVPACPA